MNKRLWRLASLFLLLAAVGNVACSKQNVESHIRGLGMFEGQWRDSVRTALSDAYENQVLVIGENRMPIWWTVYGDKPADGRSLCISVPSQMLSMKRSSRWRLLTWTSIPTRST